MDDRTRMVRRRTFLQMAAMSVGSIGLAACQAAPPAAPSKPAEPAKPAAAPPAATTAPAARGSGRRRSQARRGGEASRAQARRRRPNDGPAPAAAPAKPAEPKIGASLIGKLEGPDVLPDAKRPPKLGEAPMLAELVKAGKLPPVDQRVPLEPMVLKPLHEIGKYGGTWRRGFTGPGDGENGNRVVATDRIFGWDYTGRKMVPERRPGLGGQRRQQDVHLLPAEGPQVVGRRAVHRRRLRVLVRGHLPEQRPDPDPDRRARGQRQAGHHREGRRDDRPASPSRSRTRSSWKCSAGPASSAARCRCAATSWAASSRRPTT